MKEAVVAYSTVVSQNLPGGIEESHKISQSRQPVSKSRFITGASKYEAGVLTTQLQCLVAGPELPEMVVMMKMNMMFTGDEYKHRSLVRLNPWPWGYQVCQC
jgi:hypothetical protein